jgi:hypothetical protein
VKWPRRRGKPSPEAEQTAQAGQTVIGSVSGDVIQISHVEGDVQVTTAEARAARSAYRRQVQRIAPRELVDRSRELDAIACSCTAADGPSYVWWRAEAWAGKSALLSWFVLHPPKRVRLVSFFITARFPGQGDRVAFTDQVIEQLAELLGEPMPSFLTDATRDQCFLDLLARAAESSRRAGDRLILIVDGLDEDQGVTAGPDAYSIAALLPVTPPAGMRVVVAGRPHPPVPDDVPDDHPLRDPAIVRSLAASPRADVVKRDMLRELFRLLKGSPAEQDLLGILTAAGGGLSARDLAELTGGTEEDVAEHLNSVAGRSFGSRPSRWQADSRPEVYVLAHEELQSTAERRIGDARLAHYRQKLHAWADHYRRRKWPAETPEYLLIGYYQLLQATGDLLHMTTCAIDLERHGRMLDITGGDTAAIAEIGAAQGLVAADEDPDLATIGRLAVHRDHLALRNTSLPVRLPAVWATIGQTNRAEAIARSIPNPYRQEEALIEVAKVGARAGDSDRAVAIARLTGDAQQKALIEVAPAMAEAGDLDRAEAIARSITNSARRVKVLTSLVEAAARAGDLERAKAIAGSITDRPAEDESAIRLLEILAPDGGPDRERIAGELAGIARWGTDNWQARAQAWLAAAITKTSSHLVSRRWQMRAAAMPTKARKCSGLRS